MLAIDTNVVIRIVTEDDPPQAARARRLVAENEVFVGVTVLLESAWALEHRYDLASGDVIDGLRLFAGLPTVTIESREDVYRAMEWCEAGMDFADALHLSLGAKLDAFVTFDRDLLELARRRGLKVVEP